MSLSADAVTKILENRFDWYSARAVLRQAAERAGSPATGPFDAKALNAIADSLPTFGNHVEATAAALRQAAESSTKPAPAAKAAPEAAPAAAAEPAAAPAAEAAADAASDAAKAADAKKKK